MIEAVHGENSCELILISGYDDFAYAKQALKYEVKGYLVKPIDDDEFSEVLSNTVESVKLNRYHKFAEEELDQLHEGKTPFWLQPDFALSDSKEKFIAKAVEHLQRHCQEDLTVRHLADALNISDSYLSKLLRNHAGYSFLGLGHSQRIQEYLIYAKTA